MGIVRMRGGGRALTKFLAHVQEVHFWSIKVGGGGKGKKFQAYPEIPMLWSDIRILV